jgi:hypothetical protein
VRKMTVLMILIASCVSTPTRMWVTAMLCDTTLLATFMVLHR